MFTFDILTIFPGLIEGYLSDSIIKREILKKTIRVRVHDIRTYSKDKRKGVDDRPYGGGAGMLMTPQPLYDCITAVKRKNKEAKVVYMSPTGKLFDYAMAKKIAATIMPTKSAQIRSAKKNAKQKNTGGIILLCGRYEGIDERVRKLCIDEEISIGNYVLTGGELPALVVLDAVTRLLPGALGDERSAHEDSFTEALEGKKEYPHYTRPPEFKGLKVPKILQSGNHAKIEEWRRSKLK